MDNPDPFSNKTEEQFDPSWAELVSLPSTWMIDVDDTPIGHLGWVPHAERIGEFYIVIGDTSYWRQGFGRMVVKLCASASLRLIMCPCPCLIQPRSLSLPPYYERARQLNRSLFQLTHS